MYTVPEQVTAANKEGLETFLGFAGITASAAERLVELNLATAKAAFAEASKNAKTIVDVKDVQELVSMQGTLAQPAAEKVLGYLKAGYGILSETQAEFGKLFESRLAELNKGFVSAIEKAAKNAPAGSEVAVAAVKSAVASANQAYDAFTKASKQVSDLTEATMSAAAAGTPAKKKAA